jgi:hypothetical protein
MRGQAPYLRHESGPAKSPLYAPLPISASGSAFLSPTTPLAAGSPLPSTIPSANADPLGTSSVTHAPVPGIGGPPKPPLSPANVPLPATPMSQGGVLAPEPALQPQPHPPMNLNGRTIDGTQSMFIPRVAELGGGAPSQARSPSSPFPSTSSAPSPLSSQPPMNGNSVLDPLSQSAIVPGVGNSGRLNLVNPLDRSIHSTDTNVMPQIGPRSAIVGPSGGYSYDPLGGNQILSGPSGGQGRAPPISAPSAGAGLTFAQQQAQLAARRQVQQREAAQREAARKLANFL